MVGGVVASLVALAQGGPKSLHREEMSVRRVPFVLRTVVHVQLDVSPLLPLMTTSYHYREKTKTIIIKQSKEKKRISRTDPQINKINREVS